MTLIMTTDCLLKCPVCGELFAVVVRWGTTPSGRPLRTYTVPREHDGHALNRGARLTLIDTLERHIAATSATSNTP